LYGITSFHCISLAESPYEDITPAGSEQEYTSEDREYDEESTESNGEGFGARYNDSTAGVYTAKTLAKPNSPLY